MSLIQRGRGLVKMGTAGLAQNAQLEAAENRTRQQIDDAKKAGQMQMIGQGGGIGAMYGINSARTAGQGISGSLAAPGQTLAGTPIAPISSTLVPPPTVLADGTVSLGLQGATNSGVSVAQGMELAGITSGATTGGAATGGAAAGGATTVGTATGTVGTAGAGAAGAGTGAAAASTPILSTMATIAAPIAIGLGVAYLISELFD